MKEQPRGHDPVHWSRCDPTGGLNKPTELGTDCGRREGAHSAISNCEKRNEGTYDSCTLLETEIVMTVPRYQATRRNAQSAFHGLQNIKHLTH
jgi:hypothetical protein